jgi:adhesin transport system outer membrane protein
MVVLPLRPSCGKISQYFQGAILSARSFRFICLLGVATSLCAASVSAETLPQAVGAALNTHPTLEQAMAVQQSARESVTEEKSAYYPKLSASTAVGRVYGDNATSRGLSVDRGSGYSWLWEGSLGVNQMIFDGFRTERLVGAAKARQDGAVASLQDVRETLALQTALSYLNVLRARDSLSSVQGYLSILDDYRNRISAMVDEGAADDAELQQANEIRLEVENLIASFSGQLRIAEAEYARLTGHLPDETLVRPLDIVTSLPATAGEAVSLAWTQHPQVQRSNQDIIASGFSADAEKSSLYPTVTGELSAYAKDVDDLIGGEVKDHRALVRASWEISTGGAELARIRRAKQDYISSKAKKSDVLRGLEAAIRTAYADLTSNADQKRILTERLNANEKLKQTYNVQFEGAKVRILQLLQVENQVLNAKLDLMNADYRHLAAQYSVLGSMGRLQSQLNNGQQ